jgi:hypothetical protein
MPASLRGGGLEGGAWALTRFYFDICGAWGGMQSLRSREFVWTILITRLLNSQMVGYAEVIGGPDLRGSGRLEVFEALNKRTPL